MRQLQNIAPVGTTRHEVQQEPPSDHRLIKVAPRAKIGNSHSLLRRPRIDRVSRVAQHLLAVREIEIVLDHHAS